MKQDKRIVLSENRKQEFLDGKILSRYSIVYQAVSGHPTRHFGSLHLLSETTLGSRSKEQLAFDVDMQLLIIPLIGRIQIHNATKQHVADVEEAVLISIEPGEECTIFNDFENSEVHYMTAGFASHEPADGIARFSLVPDKLLTLFDDVSLRGLMKVSIGQWKGRSEGEFIPSTPNTFAWVVQGAFEIANCLLQKADGLAVRGSEKIEFEALSNEAIIIFVEMV
ncbi:hypothetical protein [Algoriphagus sp. AGSA1]|uniref:hypothetical protein n=1 Tax=Algoriphagus sp. AGSA1 TaxID=2907213 RepID=UPI001F457D04|nr:hypothetical protein [Algoriphagus sp. AGSA1]